MTKSFIKFKPITASSEAHNFRKVLPKYLIENETENVYVSDGKIAEVRADIEKRYTAYKSQKMQKKATPIREAVVLLPNDDNDTNLANLFELNRQLEERYGIRAFQTVIHNDEGHKRADGTNAYNYHAHIVFNWTNEKGIAFRLNRQDMSDIQTLTAECLTMERGLKGSKSLSLNHHQYRGFMQIRDELEKSLKVELSKEQLKEIRTKILDNGREESQNKSRDSKGISR